MSRQVVWTKIILETFLEESGLNDRVSMGDGKARILEGIMRTRCAGKTILDLMTLQDTPQLMSLI